MVSDSTLNLNFTILSFVEFRYRIKEEYPQLSEYPFNILLLFLVLYLCEVEFYFIF